MSIKAKILSDPLLSGGIFRVNIRLLFVAGVGFATWLGYLSMSGAAKSLTDYLAITILVGVFYRSLLNWVHRINQGLWDYLPLVAGILLIFFLYFH